MRYVLVLGCLYCVASQNNATTLTTQFETHCCDVLRELYKFMGERDENDCAIDDTGNCHSLPIMVEFRKQANALLESTWDATTDEKNVRRTTF